MEFVIVRLSCLSYVAQFRLQQERVGIAAFFRASSQINYLHIFFRRALDFGFAEIRGWILERWPTPALTEPSSGAVRVPCALTAHGVSILPRKRISRRLRLTFL